MKTFGAVGDQNLILIWVELCCEGVVATTCLVSEQGSCEGAALHPVVEMHLGLLV